MDAEAARSILETLAAHGIPPDDGAESFTAGFDPLLATIEERYFDRLLRNGKSGFKLVQARYGGGKTHFLYCIRSIAWSRDFVVAIVNLAPGSCAYDHPAQVYRAVAERLEARIDGLRVGSGIDRVLAARLRSVAASAGEGGVRDWLRSTVRSMPADSLSFGAAVHGYFKSLLDGDERGRLLLAAWLRGEPVTAADVRPFGVHERLGNANAFRMLRSLCRVVREIGFSGTVLMFDEVDRLISPRGSPAAFTDNLRDIVDLVGRHDLPGTLFLYAVPGEEFWRIVAGYQALHERLRPALPEATPFGPVIDLESLGMEEAELLAAIGGRLCDLHALADGGEGPAARANVSRIAAACADRRTDRGDRRLFVKTAASLLLDGGGTERALSDDDIRSALRRTAAARQGGAR